MSLLPVKNWMGCKDGDSLGEATKTGADKVGLTCMCSFLEVGWDAGWAAIARLSVWGFSHCASVLPQRRELPLPHLT